MRDGRVLLALFISLAVFLAAGIGPPASADGPRVDHVRLARTPGGISMVLKTSGLTPGDVVTVWWIIDPGPDPDNPGPNFSVLRAAGHVIGSSGKGNFAGHLRVGQATFRGPGLQDPHTDEVLLIVRTHGPKDPANIVEQLFTPEEDCSPDICMNLLFVLP